MAEELENRAWLEGGEIGRVPIQGTCSIGRASSNQVVLNEQKISRRHALIHSQGKEYWLVDPGSSNGILLNGRRVTHSVRLRDEDRLQIGSFRLVFRQPVAPPPMGTAGETAMVANTVSEIKPLDCWLLVVDIESSTNLSQRLSPDQLPIVTGEWFHTCRSTVEKEGGAIDKNLGDGFLAYWPGGPNSDRAVANALKELKAIQARGPIPFRLVVHFGRVFTGGAVASGVERFFGPEINFLFKSERLASTLGTSCLMSLAAYENMKERSEIHDLGQHEVTGFSGRFSFYRF